MLRSSSHILRVVSLALLAAGLCAAGAEASDRCATFSQDVRRAHFAQFGLDFPWWYGVAQLKKESGCRDVVSRDGVGSEGPAQITWRWHKERLERAGIVEIRTRSNHLRAQALLMHDAWRQSPQKLWVAYQIYNGGGLVLREISRAGEVDHAKAREHCRRRDITFNNGQVINACDINYGYSVTLHRYAETYRTGNDSERFRYW